VTVTRMRTADNEANLAQSFLGAVRARYGNTRLARQELDGEIIEDRPDALWKRDWLESEAEAHGALTRIVVALDPPATAKATSDACGIIAAGLDRQGNAFVLADETCRGLSPNGWAGRAVKLYHRLDADCLIAESNQGGDMVAAVIRSVDPRVAVRLVRARRSKWLRAEPVAALYEQRRVFHAARFPELEDEMCDFGPSGLTSGLSPDRVDALVWAIGELLLWKPAGPRLRGLDF